MTKNKVILIMPGEQGLYLKDALPPFIHDRVKGFLSRLLKSQSTIPLSLLTLAPYFKKGGFEPVIIDGRVEDALKKIKAELDDRVVYVGISSLTGKMIYYGLECAKYVRELRPDIPIVWGGVHVTLSADQSLATSEYVDIVVRGEGEVTGVELAKALAANSPLDHIEGISYRRNGQVIHNKDRDFIDFSEQLELDYSGIDINLYSPDHFLYQSERGCPHRCAFCDVIVVHKRSYRKKTAETVLRDLESIQTRFKPRKIVFVDDCFFTDFKRAQYIINGLAKRGGDIKWHASCRAQYFRKTDVDFWKNARLSGLDEVYVGIESGSQKILDYIDKDCTVEDILNGAEQIDKAGIVFMTNLMSGFPAETAEDVHLSMNLIDRLNTAFPRSMQLGRIFLYAPCQGTPLYYKVVDAGFKPPQSLEEWGRFRIGHRSHTEWHPLVDFLWAVSICSMFGRPFKWAITRQRLKRMNIPGIIRDLLGHIAWYRWKARYFKYPIDLKLIDWIDRVFYTW